jgi:sulfate transport system ATP-binding protein
MRIELSKISKTFGAFAALRDVDLTIEHGELVALLGPSGSGKTTLLRIIAGLEAPDALPGSALLFADEEVSRRPVRQRCVGFVFQHYALFRHMTVMENVAFGLRVKPRRERPGRAEIRQRVHALLHLVQLEGLAARYPSELSGGQRQRVALARALAVEPRVLLLDEPFGALDARVRQELRQWLRRLHDELHVTSVFVTHDQEEALEVADRVVVMNEGRIMQTGTPEQVFHEPADEFVMSFLGSVNVFHGRVEGGKASLGPLEFAFGGGAAGQSAAARAFVRPHELEVEAEANGNPSFRARVEHINAAGPRVRVNLVTDDGMPIHAEVSLERHRELGLRPGQTVYVSVRDVRLSVDAEREAVEERLYALTGIRRVES